MPSPVSRSGPQTKQPGKDVVRMAGEARLGIASVGEGGRGWHVDLDRLASSP